MGVSVTVQTAMKTAIGDDGEGEGDASNPDASRHAPSPFTLRPRVGQCEDAESFSVLGALLRDNGGIEALVAILHNPALAEEVTPVM